jgi:hypothetical protein
LRKPANNSAIVIACLAYSVTLAATVAYAAPNQESNNNDKPAVVLVNTKSVDDSATLVKSEVKTVKVKTVKAAPAAKLSRFSVPTTGFMTELVGRKKISKVELYKLLKAVGFKGQGLKIAFALVLRESRCHPTSHNTNRSTGDNSYGLFQINMIDGLGVDRKEVFGLTSYSALYDPVINAQAAYYMSKGEDFSSWGLGPNPYRLGAGEATLKEWYDDYYAIAKRIAKESK